MNGKGKWAPVNKNIRPTYEDERMIKYLEGEFIKIREKK